MENPESIDKDTLVLLQGAGGTWAAYRNSELGHRDLGHLKFLRVGEGCTFTEAPEHLPDTPTEINWRYMHVGYVDLETGLIVDEMPKEKTA